ncbi:MAG: histone deacetylase [Flavobacteriaceae bacterium]|nr:histone deacetylase [Flavobacteriaceae bacterium]
MTNFIPIAYHKKYKLKLPKGHRFPMEKYELLPLQLIHEGVSSQNDFFLPEYAKLEDVLEIHDKEYVLKLINSNLNKSEIRKIGFPLTEELVDREFLIAGGTIMGAEKAIKHGISMNIAGGTHHAFSNKGEAFCLLNDQAIAAKYLINKKKINKILIVDLDVHQGNGTASIFKSNKKVFTFSMHGEKNFPFKKEKSDLDIELEDNTSDKKYINKLEDTLIQLMKEVNPQFVFYLSGVDVLDTDKLGRISLSLEGCKKRDQIVFSICKNEKIPIQCSMGGGYSKDIRTIVNAHSNTFKMANEIFT